MEEQNNEEKGFEFMREKKPGRWEENYGNIGSMIGGIPVLLGGWCAVGSLAIKYELPREIYVPAMIGIPIVALTCASLANIKGKEIGKKKDSKLENKLEDQ